MRFDEPDVREAYRRGARDAYECAAAGIRQTEARKIKAWLDELDGWRYSDPPLPPLPPQA